MTLSAPVSWRRSAGSSSLERAAQVGGVLAAYVVETVGTQEYDFTPAEFVARVEGSFGAEAAKDVAAHLS